jgi:hypothetical protein
LHLKNDGKGASMNEEQEEKSLTTADLVAATEMPTAERETNRDRKEPVIENQNANVASKEGQLVSLFLPDAAKD